MCKRQTPIHQFHQRLSNRLSCFFDMLHVSWCSKAKHQTSMHSWKRSEMKEFREKPQWVHCLRPYCTTPWVIKAPHTYTTPPPHCTRPFLFFLFIIICFLISLVSIYKFQKYLHIDSAQQEKNPEVYVRKNVRNEANREAFCSLLHEGKAQRRLEKWVINCSWSHISCLNKRELKKSKKTSEKSLSEVKEKKFQSSGLLTSSG